MSNKAESDKAVQTIMMDLENLARELDNDGAIEEAGGIRIGVDLIVGNWNDGRYD